MASCMLLICLESDREMTNDLILVFVSQKCFLWQVANIESLDQERRVQFDSNLSDYYYNLTVCGEKSWALRHH